MSITASFNKWSKARQINEEMASFTAYDEAFPNHPDYIHRFLPAAFRHVRSDQDKKMLEFKDKDAFRREVAHSAYMMHKLSNSDLGAPDPMQQFYDQYALNESYAEGRIHNFRAFRMMEPNQYLAILDEKTFMGVTLDELYFQMAAKMDPVIAKQVLERLREVGEVVWNDPIPLPTMVK